MEILIDVLTSTVFYAENIQELFQKLTLYYHYKRFKKTSYLESCLICFPFCLVKLAAAKWRVKSNLA